MDIPYTTYYLIGGVFILLLIFLAGWGFIRQSRKKKRPTPNENYVKALNFLLEGDLNQAVHHFHQAVMNDTENIDAYLKLGDIFREQKKVDKAIKVHQELLVRRNLNPVYKTQIYRSLILDYAASRRYDKALETLNAYLAIEPKNIWAKEQQIKIYEAKKDWPNAFKALKQLSKLQAIDNLSQRLALYKVEEAKRKFESGDEKAGRILLREAIKVDPHCAAAYIALGDSYVRENRENDAVKAWIDFVKASPDKSHLIFDRLQDVLYSLGTYSELERILDDLYLSDKAGIEGILLLADIRVRKGDVDGAIEICESALERIADGLPVKLRLIKLYHRKGLDKKAVDLAVSLSDTEFNQPRRYVCAQCGFESNEPAWHCRRCGAWNSFGV